MADFNKVLAHALSNKDIEDNSDMFVDVFYGMAAAEGENKICKRLAINYIERAIYQIQNEYVKSSARDEIIQVLDEAWNLLTVRD